MTVPGRMRRDASRRSGEKRFALPCRRGKRPQIQTPVLGGSSTPTRKRTLARQRWMVFSSPSALVLPCGSAEQTRLLLAGTSPVLPRRRRLRSAFLAADWRCDHLGDRHHPAAAGKNKKRGLTPRDIKLSSGRYATVQSSTFSPGTRLNSWLLVTIVRPWVIAMAAMSRSFGPMTWPRVSSASRISA